MCCSSRAQLDEQTETTNQSEAWRNGESLDRGHLGRGGRLGLVHVGGPLVLLLGGLGVVLLVSLGLLGTLLVLVNLVAVVGLLVLLDFL